MKWKRALTVLCVLTAVVVGGAAFGAEDEKEAKEEKRPLQRANGERRWGAPAGGAGPRGEKGMSGRKALPGRGQHLQRIMERLKEQNPEKYEELMKLKEENPELLHQRLHEFGRKLGERRMGRAPDPEMQEKMRETIELEGNAQKLASSYREAKTDEEKKKALDELKATVEKIFDLKLAAQEKGVQLLEKKLKELKDLLEKRKAAREEIIQNRMDRLTGKNRHLEW